jgi:tyrosyl-tRNA synthetase
VVNGILFSDLDPRSVDANTLALLAQEIPTAHLSSTDGLSLVDAVVQAGLAKSKSEARRAIEQGGIYVNQQRVKDAARMVEPGDWLGGGNLLLRKGKKDYALLRVTR